MLKTTKVLIKTLLLAFMVIGVFSVDKLPLNDWTVLEYTPELNEFQEFNLSFDNVKESKTRFIQFISNYPSDSIAYKVTSSTHPTINAERDILLLEINETATVEMKLSVKLTTRPFTLDATVRILVLVATGPAIFEAPHNFNVVQKFYEMPSSLKQQGEVFTLDVNQRKKFPADTDLELVIGSDLESVDEIEYINAEGKETSVTKAKRILIKSAEIPSKIRVTGRFAAKNFEYNLRTVDKFISASKVANRNYYFQRTYQEFKNEAETKVYYRITATGSKELDSRVSLIARLSNNEESTLAVTYEESATDALPAKFSKTAVKVGSEYVIDYVPKGFKYIFVELVFSKYKNDVVKYAEVYSTADMGYFNGNETSLKQTVGASNVLCLQINAEKLNHIEKDYYFEYADAKSVVVYITETFQGLFVEKTKLTTPVQNLNLTKTQNLGYLNINTNFKKNIYAYVYMKDNVNSDVNLNFKFNDKANNFKDINVKSNAITQDHVVAKTTTIKAHFVDDTAEYVVYPTVINGNVKVTFDGEEIKNGDAYVKQKSSSNDIKIENLNDTKEETKGLKSVVRLLTSNVITFNATPSTLNNDGKLNFQNVFKVDKSIKQLTLNFKITGPFNYSVTKIKGEANDKLADEFKNYFYDGTGTKKNYLLRGTPVVGKITAERTEGKQTTEKFDFENLVGEEIFLISCWNDINEKTDNFVITKVDKITNGVFPVSSETKRSILAFNLETLNGTERFLNLFLTFDGKLGFNGMCPYVLINPSENLNEVKSLTEENLSNCYDNYGNTQFLTLTNFNGIKYDTKVKGYLIVDLNNTFGTAQDKFSFNVKMGRFFNVNDNLSRVDLDKGTDINISVLRLTQCTGCVSYISLYFDNSKIPLEIVHDTTTVKRNAEGQYLAKLYSTTTTVALVNLSDSAELKEKTFSLYVNVSRPKTDVTLNPKESVFTHELTDNISTLKWKPLQEGEFTYVTKAYVIPFNKNELLNEKNVFSMFSLYDKLTLLNEANALKQNISETDNISLSTVNKGIYNLFVVSEYKEYGNAQFFTPQVKQAVNFTKTTTELTGGVFHRFNYENSETMPSEQFFFKFTSSKVDPIVGLQIISNRVKISTESDNPKLASKDTQLLLFDLEQKDDSLNVEFNINVESTTEKQVLDTIQVVLILKSNKYTLGNLTNTINSLSHFGKDNVVNFVVNNPSRKVCDVQVKTYDSVTKITYKEKDTLHTITDFGANKSTSFSFINEEGIKNAEFTVYTQVKGEPSISFITHCFEDLFRYHKISNQEDTFNESGLKVHTLLAKDTIRFSYPLKDFIGDDKHPIFNTQAMYVKPALSGDLSKISAKMLLVSSTEVAKEETFPKEKGYFPYDAKSGLTIIARTTDNSDLSKVFVTVEVTEELRDWNFKLLFSARPKEITSFDFKKEVKDLVAYKNSVNNICVSNLDGQYLANNGANNLYITKLGNYSVTLALNYGNVEFFTDSLQSNIEPEANIKFEGNQVNHYSINYSEFMKNKVFCFSYKYNYSQTSFPTEKINLMVNAVLSNQDLYTIPKDKYFSEFNLDLNMENTSHIRIPYSNYAELIGTEFLMFDNNFTDTLSYSLKQNKEYKDVLDLFTEENPVKLNANFGVLTMDQSKNPNQDIVVHVTPAKEGVRTLSQFYFVPLHTKSSETYKLNEVFAFKFSKSETKQKFTFSFDADETFGVNVTFIKGTGKVTYVRQDGDKTIEYEILEKKTGTGIRTRTEAQKEVFDLVCEQTDDGTSYVIVRTFSNNKETIPPKPEPTPDPPTLIADEEEFLNVFLKLNDIEAIKNFDNSMIRFLVSSNQCRVSGFAYHISTSENFENVQDFPTEKQLRLTSIRSGYSKSFFIKFDRLNNVAQFDNLVDKPIYLTMRLKMTKDKTGTDLLYTNKYLKEVPTFSLESRDIINLDFNDLIGDFQFKMNTKEARDSNRFFVLNLLKQNRSNVTITSRDNKSTTIMDAFEFTKVITLQAKQTESNFALFASTNKVAIYSTEADSDALVIPEFNLNSSLSFDSKTNTFKWSDGIQNYDKLKDPKVQYDLYLVPGIKTLKDLPLYDFIVEAYGKPLKTVSKETTSLTIDPQLNGVYTAFLVQTETTSRISHVYGLANRITFDLEKLTLESTGKVYSSMFGVTHKSEKDEKEIVKLQVLVELDTSKIENVKFLQISFAETVEYNKFAFLYHTESTTLDLNTNDNTLASIVDLSGIPAGLHDFMITMEVERAVNTEIIVQLMLFDTNPTIKMDTNVLYENYYFQNFNKAESKDKILNLDFNDKLQESENCMVQLAYDNEKIEKVSYMYENEKKEKVEKVLEKKVGKTLIAGFKSTRVEGDLPLPIDGKITILKKDGDSELLLGVLAVLHCSSKGQNHFNYFQNSGYARVSNLAEETHYNFIYNIAPFESIEKEIHRLQAFLLTIVDQDKVYATAFAEVIDPKEIKADTFPRTKENSKFSLGSIQERLTELQFFPEKETPLLSALAFTVNIKPKPTNQQLKEDDIARYNHSYTINFSNRISPLTSLKDYENKNLVLNSHAYTIFELSDFDEIVHNDLLALYLGTDSPNVVLYVSYQFHGFDVNFYDKNSSDESDFKLESINNKFFLLNIHEHKMYYSVDQQISRADGLYFYFHLENDFKKQREETIRFQARWTYDDLFLVNQAEKTAVAKSRNLDMNLFLLKDQSARVLFDFSNVEHSLTDEYFVYTSHETKVVKEGEGEAAKDVTYQNVNLSYINNEAGDKVDKDSNLNKLFYPSEGFKSLDTNGIVKLSDLLNKSKTALLKVENNKAFNNEYSVYTNFNFSKLLSQNGEALSGLEFNRTYAVKLNKENPKYKFEYDNDSKYLVKVEYPQGNIDKVGIQVNTDPADEVLKNMPRKTYLIENVEGKETVQLSLMAKEEEAEAYSIVLVTFVQQSPEFIYVEKNKDIEKEEGDKLYLSVKLKELNEDLSLLQNSLYIQHETFGIKSFTYTLSYNPSYYSTHKDLPSASETLVRSSRSGSVAANLVNFSMIANDFKAETEVYLNIVIEKTPTDKAYVPFVLHHRKDRILRISDTEKDYRNRTISQFNDDRFFLFMDNPNDKKYLMNVAINILGNSGKIYFKNCIGNSEACKFKQVESDFQSFFNTFKENYKYVKNDRLPMRGIFEFRVLYNENSPNTVFVNLVRNAEFAEDYVTAQLPVKVKQSEADNGQIKVELEWEVPITTKSKETTPQPAITYELFYVKLKLGDEAQDREYFAYHLLEGKKFTENNNLCQTPTLSCNGLLPNGQYDLFLVAFEENTGKYASYKVSKNVVLSQAMKPNDLSTISLSSQDDYTVFYHFKINKNQEYWFNLSSVDQFTTNTTLKIFNRNSRTHYIFELDNGTKLQRGKFLTGEELNIEDEYVVEIHAVVSDARETTDLNFFNTKFEKDDEKVAKVNLANSSKFSYSNYKDFKKIIINVNSMSSFKLNLQQEDYVIKSIEVMNDKSAVVKTYNSEEISAKNTDLTFTPPALKLSEPTTPINFSLVINLDEAKLAAEVKDEKLISIFVIDVSKNGTYQFVEFKNLVKRGLAKLFLGLTFRAKDTIRLIADLTDYKYKSDEELTVESVVGFLKLSNELVNVRAKFVTKPQDLSTIKEADFPLLTGDAVKDTFANTERGLSFRKQKDLHLLLLTIEYTDKDAKNFNNYSIQLYDAPKYVKIDTADKIYSLELNVDFNSPQVAFIPTDLSFMDIGDFLIYSHNVEYQIVFSYGQIPYSSDQSFSNIANYDNYVDFSKTKLTRVLVDDNKIFKKEELFMTIFANKNVNEVKGKIEFKLTNGRFVMSNTDSLIYSNVNLLKGISSYTYVENTSKSDVKDTFVLSLDKLSGNGILKYKVINKHDSKYDSLESLFNFEGEGIVTVDSGFAELEVENTKDVLIEITSPNSNFLGEIFFGKYLERIIANENVFNVNVGSVNFFKMTDKNEGSLRILNNSETEQMGLLFTQMSGKGTTEFTIGDSKVTVDNEKETQMRLLSTGAKVCNISFSKKEGDDKFRIIRVFSSYGVKVGDNLVKPNERMTFKVTDLSKTVDVLVRFKQEYENNYVVLEAPAGLFFEKVNYDIFSEFQSYDQEKNVLFASPEKALRETSEFQGERFLTIKVPATQMAGFLLLVVKLKDNKKQMNMRALLNRQIFGLKADEAYSFDVSHFEEKENAKLEPKKPVELSYHFTNVRALQIKNSPDVSLLSLNLYLNEEKPFNCQFNFKDAEMTKHSFTIENNEIRKNLFIQHNSKLEHFHVELRCLKGFENSMFAIINFVDASYANIDYSLKNTDYTLEYYSSLETEVGGVKVKQTTVSLNTKESFVPKLSASVDYYVAHSTENKGSLSIYRFLQNDKKFTIAKVTKENRFNFEGFDFEKNFYTKVFAYEVNSGRVVAYKDYTYNQLKYGSSWWVILLIILAVLIFIGIIVIVVHNVMKNRRMQSEDLNRNLLSEDNNRSSVNDP